MTFLSYFADRHQLDLRQDTDLLQIVSDLPFLRSLHLNHCILPSTLPSFLSYKNSSTTLHVRAPTGNTLNDAAIFWWMPNLSEISIGLEQLNLSYNKIRGPIPNALGRNMHSALCLDLVSNEFQGPIPSASGNMCLLSYLNAFISQSLFK